MFMQVQLEALQDVIWLLAIVYTHFTVYAFQQIV